MHQPRRTTCAALLLAVLSGGLSAAPAQAAVPLNDCANTDNGDPVVTGLDITPRSVDVTRGPRAVTVTVTAHDTGGPGPATGISQVSVTLGVYRSGFGPGPHIALEQVSSGVWRGSAVLVPGSGLAGVLRAGISFRDAAQQGSHLSARDLGTLGLDPLMKVRDRNPYDTERPVMTSLELSSTTVDSRRGPGEIRVRARLRDGLSGVGRVLVTTDVAGARLHLVTGSRRDGVWAGKMSVGRWVGTHTSGLYVKIFDRAGARRIYGRSALRDKGFPDRLRIVARPDVTAPHPSLDSALPAALDVRAADVAFPVRLHLVDADSGVAKVTVHLETANGTNRAPSTNLLLTEGTPADGYWEGLVRLSHCSAVTASYQLFVRATDVRGNIRTPTLEEGAVAVTAGDNAVQPSSGRVGTWAHPAVLHVAFGEDVFGISPTSAVVRRTEYRPSVTTTVVGGSWACSDGSGQVTSCAEGPVRSATVTLTDPPVENSDYQVLLNPEHVLDVTDRAGNPFRRTEISLGRCCTP